MTGSPSPERGCLRCGASAIAASAAREVLRWRTSSRRAQDTGEVLVRVRAAAAKRDGLEDAQRRDAPHDRSRLPARGRQRLRGRRRGGRRGRHQAEGRRRGARQARGSRERGRSPSWSHRRRSGRWCQDSWRRLSLRAGRGAPGRRGRRAEAILGKGRLRPGQTVFINGCLGGVGRAAARYRADVERLGGRQRCRAHPSSRRRHASSASARSSSSASTPQPLEGRFDLVFDTASAPLSAAAARTAAAARRPHPGHRSHAGEVRAQTPARGPARC